MTDYNVTNTTTDTPSEAEKKVHAAGYVLYFIGVLNLLLVLGSSIFRWNLFPGVAMFLGIAEAAVYLLLGYLVHKKHSATALTAGIILVLLAGAGQIYAGITGAVPMTSLIGPLVMRAFLLAILFRAMPGAQALGPEA